MQCTLTLEDGDEELVQKVSLPIIHNIKDVKQGEELVLYVEPNKGEMTVRIPPERLNPAQ